MTLERGHAVDVVRADYLSTYRLRIVFSDRRESVVDFGPFLRGSLNPQTRRFLNRARFRSYVLKDGNLVWGDYDMCFSIEQLYRGSIGAGSSVDAYRARAVAEDRAEYGPAAEPAGGME